MKLFKYKKIDGGHTVIHCGKSLGDIKAQKERAGRHAFSLAIDKRRKPRTYRGKQKAAEALLAIHTLVKKHSDPSELVVAAWSSVPKTPQISGA